MFARHHDRSPCRDEVVGPDDAAHPDHQEMEADQGGDQDGQEEDVEAVHLPEVHDIEEGAGADGVEAVFALDRDPLGVEVLL